MSRVILLALLSLVGHGRLVAGDPGALMPHARDHTQMWWAEGFPSHTPAAPWLRCIQTGPFAFAPNAATMRVPHLGVIDGAAYDAAALPARRRHFTVQWLAGWKGAGIKTERS
jgi:hypothetical protein